jgi:hypothetical protein
VEHGEEGNRGFKPERQVTVKQVGQTGRQEWVVRYHMTDPRKISMCERRELVDNVAMIVGEVQQAFPMAEVTYMTIFPRHVEKCCEVHMTDDDLVLMDGIRREVDRDIVEVLREQDGTVRIAQWWEILGLGGDMTPDVTKMKGVVDKDGVHLTDHMNKVAASAIYHRCTGKRAWVREAVGRMASQHGGIVKKARW